MASQTPSTQASLAYGQSGTPRPTHKFSNIPPAATSNTESFIRTTTGGADFLIASSLRPAGGSVAARHARVGREVTDSLAKLGKPGN